MLKIGDWVHTVHNGNKITGFIKDTNGRHAIVFVTIPDNYGVITSDLSDLIEGESNTWLEDIPVLIGLSIQINDNEWLRCLINELDKWKSPHSINWN